MIDNSKLPAHDRTTRRTSLGESVIINVQPPNQDDGGDKDGVCEPRRPRDPLPAAAIALEEPRPEDGAEAEAPPDGRVVSRPRVG